MKIIDSHVHLWHPEVLSYSWVTGNEILERPYLPTDYAEMTANYEVEGIVFVEAGCDDDDGAAEAEWVASLDAPVKAIVAHAPLEKGEAARSHLEALKNRPLVKGIRRIYQDDAPGFARQPDFIKGVQLLPEYGLSFDICIKWHQLEETIDLVKQCPDVSFVLDHIAKPDIAAGEYDTWATHMKTLASCENVFCKISGMITEADHDNWTAEQLKPYILHVIDCFGLEQVMFGSDWPVVRLAGSWVRWMQALLPALENLSENEKQALFADNAREFYRIDS